MYRGKRFPSHLALTFVVSALLMWYTKSIIKYLQRLTQTKIYSKINTIAMCRNGKSNLSCASALQNILQHPPSFPMTNFQSIYLKLTIILCANSLYTAGRLESGITLESSSLFLSILLHVQTGFKAELPEVTPSVEKWSGISQQPNVKLSRRNGSMLASWLNSIPKFHRIGG